MLPSVISQLDSKMTYSTVLLKIKTVIKNVSVLCKSKKSTISKTSSPAGNRTPVSRVTGRDTHHYTTEEFVNCVVALKDGHNKEPALTDGWELTTLRLKGIIFGRLTVHLFSYSNMTSTLTCR